jgi:Ca2+-binding EF-hand superfamily protein
MDHDKYLQIMRKIDQHVKKKMLKINTIFQQFDSSGDGQLSKKEFTQGVVVLLKNAPFDITKADMHGVFDTIDNDHSNEMSFKEFVKELRNSDPVRQASLDKKLHMEKLQGNSIQKQQALVRASKKQELEERKRLSQQLDTIEGDPLSAVSDKARQFLQKNMQKAINLFRTMDTSGDNLIDQKELSVGLKKLGLLLTEAEFTGLWAGLDVDGSGACDLVELEDALRNTDPVRKARLEKFSQPPLLKPFNSIEEARSHRDRRVPGSLSWIMQRSTPKSKLRPANPAYYKSQQVPGWKAAGTVSVNFPTAFRATLPVVVPPTVSASPKHTMASSGGVSPGGSPFPTKRLTESGYRRKRTKHFWRKIKQKNSQKHMATLEEKVLRCIAMREGYLHELWSAFQTSKPPERATVKAKPAKRLKKRPPPWRREKKTKKVLKKVGFDVPPSTAGTNGTTGTVGTVGTVGTAGTAGTGTGAAGVKVPMKYMHIKQLRVEVGNLLSELMRVTCETLESIEEWRAERNVLVQLYVKLLLWLWLWKMWDSAVCVYLLV